ncbi:lytic transglycosylase domain-containing protein [Kitasatospora sp. NPDC048365]|uniref:lytic transglycosylase domain-containing protein n=1 Tax=Kitasatospora sp. NPDC048365 TaxID=3364050 RepID=UPI00371F9873
MPVDRRTRTALALAAAVALTAPLAGCAKKADRHPGADAAPAAVTATATAGASPEPSPSASPSASTAPSPSASASGSASPSASATRRSASPTATRAASAPPPPVAKAGPVAPPPPPVTTPHVPPLQSSCKPSYSGANAPTATVDAALVAAAGKTRTFTLSSGGKDTMPPLPSALVKAVAWQESGWQSAILACDGGIGLMQIMPGTVTMMNNKFGTTSDPKTVEGNVQLGTQLLDWLVAYYGDSCFGGNYDLSPDPVSGKTPLLDLVIAAYNAGAGNVHYNTVTDPATGAVSGVSQIPNPSYVANVKALMTRAPWTAAH